MSEHPLIELHNVCVGFRRRRGLFHREYLQVLKDVSFTIDAGTTVGVVGRNGVGKSTLLRVIAGIIRPDAGHVVNHGANCSLLALQTGFDGRLSGRINAVLSAMLLGYTREAVEARLEAIIEFSELGDSIDYPVQTYSTGMRARLGFSIAYFMETDVILLDEVLGVGDAHFREKSAAAMKERILSDQTAVLVSHNANMIRNTCSHVIWIDGGRVVSQGEPDAVLVPYERHMAQA